MFLILCLEGPCQERPIELVFVNGDTILSEITEIGIHSISTSSGDYKISRLSAVTLKEESDSFRFLAKRLEKRGVVVSYNPELRYERDAARLNTNNNTSAIESPIISRPTDKELLRMRDQLRSFRNTHTAGVGLQVLGTLVIAGGFAADQDGIAFAGLGISAVGTIVELVSGASQ